MYDRTDDVKELNAMLDGLKRFCDIKQIPFLFIAPVYDDSRDTKYCVCGIPEKELKGKAKTKYVCDALTPGTMELDLKDDKIRDIINVMNGARVTYEQESPAIDESDLQGQMDDFENLN